jgi:hypothetical protein
MISDITPSEYISLHNAVRRLAKIKDYSEGDLVALDIGDHLKVAQDTHDKTQALRQHLCNGVLAGYYFVGDGKPHTVPEGIWTVGEACLLRVGTDMGFEDLWHFHPRGIEIVGERRPVFLIEADLEKFLKGKVKPKRTIAPRKDRKRGRPPGSSPIEDNDEEFLLLMDPMIEQGDPIMTAADIVVEENRERVWRDPASKTTDESVSGRLQRKWRESRRSSSD